MIRNYNNISFKLILLTFLGFLISLQTHAHTYEKMGIEIIHPWCAEGISNKNSMANITIANNTKNNIGLTSIKSDTIGHIMLMKDNKPVDKIIIPGEGIRGEDDFKIMFYSLKEDLKIGDNIDAFLIFSTGMEIKIKFVVGQNSMLDKEENIKKAEDQHQHEQH